MKTVEQSLLKLSKFEQSLAKLRKLEKICRKFNKVEQYWKFDACPPKLFVKISKTLHFDKSEFVIGFIVCCHFVGCCHWSGCCGGGCVSF